MRDMEKLMNVEQGEAIPPELTLINDSPEFVNVIKEEQSQLVGKTSNEVGFRFSP